MKVKTQYSCQNCGQTSPKWLGRCPGCEAWNTLVEERVGGAAPAAVQEGSLAALRDDLKSLAWENAGVHGALLTGSASEWVTLDGDLAGAGDATGDAGAQTRASEGGPSRTSATDPQRRISTGIGELDRVLGGGLVPDSFNLIGGDPGIGKSTLLLQMAKGLLEKNPSLKLFYVSGEESVEQIRGRARRMGVKGGSQVFLAAETQLERVFASVKELKPDVLVMDSLQTFSSGFLQAAPGSVSQLREVAARLMALAKTAGISVWLVGHVTKEGNIAGPKVVEHMVDTVLYFEGDQSQSYRLLRTQKNRFGSTRELGVFEMDGEGLREVANPSSLFLSERESPVPGTAVTASVEGTRPLLVELQALVANSTLAVPRRTSVGMDSARVSLLAAILERHMRLPLAEHDLFFNVSGGLRMAEPACDLAAAAAIFSSAEEVPFPHDWIFIGELGLTGEVRKVTAIDLRVREAKKLGFKTAVIPANSLKRGSEKELGIRLIELSRVDELRGLLRGQAGASVGAGVKPRASVGAATGGRARTNRGPRAIDRAPERSADADCTADCSLDPGADFPAE
jgi:DNA repair protein RadA/Sms